MVSRVAKHSRYVLKYGPGNDQLYNWPIATNPVGTYPPLVAEFYFNYSMLVLNSFGLQNAIERSAVDIGHFFIRCHSCATACATITRDGLAPKGFLKYSPDSHFVMVSYAVLSLLKVCIRPLVLSPSLIGYFITSSFDRNFKHSWMTNRKPSLWLRTLLILWKILLSTRIILQHYTVASYEPSSRLEQNLQYPMVNPCCLPVTKKVAMKNQVLEGSSVLPRLMPCWRMIR